MRRKKKKEQRKKRKRGREKTRYANGHNVSYIDAWLAHT